MTDLIVAIATAWSMLIATIVAGQPVSPPPDAAGDVLRGTATWYNADSRTAAAGSELREFIGPGWRGSWVDVCRDGETWINCVRVQLLDTCGCAGNRIIDLSDDAFSSLASLGTGVIRVEVSLGKPSRETITQPPTDTAP